jgi:hypothetical protein
MELEYSAEATGAAALIPLIIFLVVGLFELIAWWRMFSKAGRPGWAIIIPIYNLIVLCQVAGRPAWWFILMLIPIVNVVILILVWIDVARKFGHGGGFAAGLILLNVIFVPILGFGGSTYNAAA